MKKVRKLICLALAMVMALAMCATVYATEPAAATGTITVDNASKGESYKLVKVFDATYNSGNDAIIYTLINGKKITELQEYFDMDGAYVSVKTKATENAPDGSGLNTEATNAILAWAKAVPEESTNGYYQTKKTAEGGALVFDNLEPGYYVVVSRTTGGAVSVTSIGPDQTIFDKSTSDNPKFDPEAGKVVNGKKYDTAGVGDTVEYTVTYNTVNWINADGKAYNGAETRVTEYVVVDTLPNFLTNVKNLTVKVVYPGETSERDITSSINIKGTFGNGSTDVKTFSVPWVDASSNNSLYPNGTKLIIRYSATVASEVVNTHTNKVTITPNGRPGEDDDTSEADVYTGIIEVDKYVKGEPTKKLANAEFVLKNADGAYAKLDDNDVLIEWVTNKKDATVKKTNTDGKAFFKGLNDGNYKLEEIKAPDGYKKLDSDVDVEIKNATTKANVTQVAGVENDTGSRLPSTGGIGTTIFYVVGSILMLGAVVLFVTKKRSTER